MKKVTTSVEMKKTREISMNEAEVVSGGVLAKKGPAPGPGGTGGDYCTGSWSSFGTNFSGAQLSGSQYTF